MPHVKSYPIVAAVFALAVAAYAQSVPTPGAAAGPPAQAGQAHGDERTINEAGPPIQALRDQVDIPYQELSLHDAVNLLSKKAGIPIYLDARVKSNTTIGLAASGVPAFRVLMMIVHQPGTGSLMLAPQGGGVVITPYPNIKVNGETKEFRPKHPPWSDDWDAMPRRVTGPRSGSFDALADGAIAVEQPQVVGADPRSTPAAGPPVTSVQVPFPGAGGPTPPDAFQPSAQQPNPYFPGAAQQSPGGMPMPGMGPNAFPPGMQMMPGGPNPMAMNVNGALSVLVTALSDKSFVVTEPGLGPKNEIGVWLTVYRIDGAGKISGEKLHEVSRVFHRSANGGHAFAMPMMNPGMMGYPPGAGGGPPGMMPPGGYNPQATPRLNVPQSPGSGLPSYTPAPGSRQDFQRSPGSGYGPDTPQHRNLSSDLKPVPPVTPRTSDPTKSTDSKPTKPAANLPADPLISTGSKTESADSADPVREPGKSGDVLSGPKDSRQKSDR